MLLKKQENDEQIKATYKSSSILASIFDKKNNDLTIIFKKGSQYKYPNVSSTDYKRFEIDESQGVILNSHIKKYPFIKLDDIDPTAIVNEIELLVEDENKQILKEKHSRLNNAMRVLLTIENPTESDVERVSEKIIEYVNELNNK